MPLPNGMLIPFFPVLAYAALHSFHLNQVLLIVGEDIPCASICI